MSTELEVYSDCVAKQDFAAWVHYRHSTATKLLIRDISPYSILYSSSELLCDIQRCMLSGSISKHVKPYNYKEAMSHITRHNDNMPVWWESRWHEPFKLGIYKDIYAFDLLVLYLGYTRSQLKHYSFAEDELLKVPINRGAWAQRVDVTITLEEKEPRSRHAKDSDDEDGNDEQRSVLHHSMTKWRLNKWRKTNPLLSRCKSMLWLGRYRAVVKVTDKKYMLLWRASLRSCLTRVDDILSSAGYCAPDHILDLIYNHRKIVVKDKLDFIDNYSQRVIDNYDVTRSQLGAYLLVTHIMKIAGVIPSVEVYSTKGTRPDIAPYLDDVAVNPAEYITDPAIIEDCPELIATTNKVKYLSAEVIQAQSSTLFIHT